MIRINGVQIPTPSSFIASIEPLVKAERNARGTMIMEHIADKRKLEMTWTYLTPGELQQLLNAVSGTFFTVQYPDPQTGSTRTGTFYAGPRSVGALSYQNGQMRWKDVKFNVIER